LRAGNCSLVDDGFLKRIDDFWQYDIQQQAEFCFLCIDRDAPLVIPEGNKQQPFISCKVKVIIAPEGRVALGK